MSNFLDLLDYLNCCSRARGGNGSARSDTSRDSPIRMDQGMIIDTVISETISNTEKEGILDLLRNGQRSPKFFVLKHDLYWFERKGDLTPRGVLLLHSFRMIPQIGELTDTAEKHSLEINYQSSTIFRAESLSESEEWRTAIENATSHQQEGVSFEGFLDNFGLMGPEWKKLWFVLRGTELDYFESPKASEASGTITMVSPHMTAEVAVHKFMASKNMFQMLYSTSDVIVAESREEQEEWLVAVRDAIDRQQNDKMWLRKNPVGWKRAGKVREVVSPMLEMLRDPYRLEYFRWFVRDIFCEHYLLFWLDVQQFRRLCKKEDKYYLKPCALVIFQKYIRAESVQEIDLGEDAKERTLMMLEDPTVNTFRDAQLAVLQILREVYPQFLVSTYAKAMAEKMFDL